MTITLVTGEKDSGKTSRLRSLSQEESCAGCLAPKVFREGRCSGYDIELLPGQESFPLVRESGTDHPERVVRSFAGEDGERLISYGPFHFYADRFREVGEFLLEPLSDASVTRWILDEIGPLEMEGEGLAPILERILEMRGDASEGKELYLSLRPSLVAAVQEKFRFEAAGIEALSIRS